MIIGYDFWADGVYYDIATTDVVLQDNDGVAFDTCNPFNNPNQFILKGGEFDELHITKDSIEIDSNIEKTEWTLGTVLLAKFKNNLEAGTIGVDGHDIYKVELRKRKKGEETWQTYFTIDYDENVSVYTIIDKFIESAEEYEYCIRPIALSEGKEIYGANSTSEQIYISYDHAHLFDKKDSFDIIYNLNIGNITNQIGANVIETLSSQYPYVVYGQNNYFKGTLECLLVSEESATGNIDIQSEKKLRNRIIDFLNNKESKILKNADGLYMLVKIVGTPTLIPMNELIGIYQISFEYVQIANANNVAELKKLGFTFDYLEQVTYDDGSVGNYTNTRIVG